VVQDADKTANRPLRGLKVFVVEDESLIAMLLEDLLDEFECEIVGSALTLRQALAQAASVPAQVAILDINLGGDPIFPVAELLESRGIPIVFASGYGAASLPDEWRGRPSLPKPFSVEQVEEALRKAMGFKAA
jgi:DNA-binding NarL/FixJ family response regulator